MLKQGNREVSKMRPESYRCFTEKCLRRGNSTGFSSSLLASEEGEWGG
jgi:hypothetical protein